MENDECDKLVLYLSEMKYLNGTSESEKRRIRKRTATIELDVEQQLLYVGECDGEAVRKTVVTKERKKSVIKLCHKGHLGRDKTYEKCSERFYWKGMKTDIAEYIKHCEDCQVNNKKTKSAVQEMVPVQFPARVWGKVAIDLIGLFLSSDKKNPLSKNGFRYVLTVMDYFRKWPEAFPLYRKNANEVALKLHSTICRFGVMEEIVSDQGGEFNSRITSFLTSTYGINHVTTAPYHPQANGMIERFNQTLKNMLNKMIDNKGEEWDNYIEEALFHYRTSEHHSTKYSPFYIMYVRKPVLPNEQEHRNVSGNYDQQEEDIEKIVNKMEKAKEHLTANASDNINVAQNRQKTVMTKDTM